MPVSKTKIISMMLVSRPVIALVITTVIIFGGFSLYPTIVDYIHSRDGVYGPWSEWSGCLRYCGESYKGRYRRCVQPATGFGKSCAYFGRPVETTECNNGPCPVDGGVGPWGPWETKCDMDCKDGQIKRGRVCSKPQVRYYFMKCDGPLVEIKRCPTTKECDAIDAKFSQWSPWFSCTVSCGGGKRSKWRHCAPPRYGGKTCKEMGIRVYEEDCAVQKCPGAAPKPAVAPKPVAAPKPAAASKPAAAPESAAAPEPAAATEPSADHPIDAKFDPWGPFGSCSVSCGGGGRKRYRKCTPPKNGGKTCKEMGITVHEEGCALEKCPIDGTVQPT